MPIPPASSMSYHATKNYNDGSNHPSAVNNAPEGAKLIDAENRERIAKTVYADNVVYHATEEESKTSIRENGFSKIKKVDGATARLTKSVMMEGRFIRNAKNYNYVMRDKESAKSLKYFDKPTLVRTFTEGVDFEMDPDFKDGSAMRTSQDIPADNIVGSKKSAPSEGESKIMVGLMSKAGVKVNTREAGRLLREVQSDSENDF